MSQRSQSPPPAPPSPAPPPLKVITTKEETRVFKLKPKKTKASKTVSNSSSEEVKPKKEVVTAQQQHQGKRARSTSVSSNDRNKNSAPAQKTSKPNAENTPVPPSPKETTSTESKSIIWQPRPDNKTLPKTTTPTTATNRPQPPVGKILPEVRKPLSTSLECTNTVLPKPIGYRQHAPLEKKPSPGWNSTNSSSSWGLPSLPSAAAWYPENGSLFNRPIQQHQSSAQEPSRDWFGLRSLASELTVSNSGASSANMDHSTWPVTPFQVDPPSTGTLWPEIQPISSGNPVNPAVGSRVYSPWSVPHWLNVTQRQPERQEPATGQADQLGVLASGIWDAPPPRAPNNNNNQDSWNSDYSQF